MPPGGSLKLEPVDQQLVLEALRQVLEIDDVVAEPLGDRDDDLRGVRPLVAGLLHELVIALDAGLALGLAGLGRGRDPFLLALQRLLAGDVLAAFLGEALLLLHRPGRVVALIGNALAAIELEDPARDVVEEVAIVGDDQDRARIGPQMAFEPGGGLGVEMVGRLVEQQQFRLFEQELAQRDAAALAARELRDLPVVGRAAQRVHRLVDLGIEIPQALGLDLVLERRHLVGGLVRIVHGEFVVAVEDRLLRADAEHDVVADVQLLIELRLLRQVADARALGDPGLAGPFLVEAGHDLEQGRLARAVDAEHADLGVRIEGQVDVVEHLLAARIGLRQAAHMVDELTGHRRAGSALGRGDRGCREIWRVCSGAGGEPQPARRPRSRDGANDPPDIPRRVRRSSLTYEGGFPALEQWRCNESRGFVPMTAIELRLRDSAQLFNTLDPFPFRERDLSAEAERFIVEWAQELPKDQPIEIIVHLQSDGTERGTASDLATAITGWFQAREKAEAQAMRDLFRDGRLAFVIGFVVLTICVFVSWSLTRHFEGP